MSLSISGPDLRLWDPMEVLAVKRVWRFRNELREREMHVRPVVGQPREEAEG